MYTHMYTYIYIYIFMYLSIYLFIHPATPAPRTARTRAGAPAAATSTPLLCIDIKYYSSSNHAVVAQSRTNEQRYQISYPLRIGLRIGLLIGLQTPSGNAYNPLRIGLRIGLRYIMRSIL